MRMPYCQVKIAMLDKNGTLRFDAIRRIVEQRQA